MTVNEDALLHGNSDNDPFVTRLPFRYRRKSNISIPPSLWVPTDHSFSSSSRYVTYQHQTPPPDTPALSSAVSSSPSSHILSSSPFSSGRRGSSESAWGTGGSSRFSYRAAEKSPVHYRYWDRDQKSTELDEVPPLTSDVSEFSDIETQEDYYSAHGERHIPFDEDPDEDAVASYPLKVLEDENVRAAAEALLLFSDKPFERPMHSSPSPAFTGSKHKLAHLLCPDPPDALPRRKHSPPLEKSILISPQPRMASLPPDPQARPPLPSESSNDLCIPEPARPVTPPLQTCLKRVNCTTPSKVLASPSRRPLKKSRQGSFSPKSSPEPLPLELPLADGQATFPNSESQPEENPLNEPQKEEPAAQTSRATSSEPKSALDTELDSLELTPPPSPSPPLDADELRGHVISALALSRSSSMTVPAIVKTVLSMQPKLLDGNSREDLERAVRDGMASVDAVRPIFGRIKRIGKDAASHKLEDQYYYNPENDPDQSRAELLRDMMPKKRGVTKQHRQYYYEPVEKLSRWDPEDEY